MGKILESRTVFQHDMAAIMDSVLKNPSRVHENVNTSHAFAFRKGKNLLSNILNPIRISKNYWLNNELVKK
jgi:hypothetical protein